VEIPELDPIGFPTGVTRIVRLSQPQTEEENTVDFSTGEDTDFNDTNYDRSLQRLKEAETAMNQPPNIPRTPAAAAASEPFDNLGLNFLSTPPSQPTVSIKLGLSGPVKFRTALSCHYCAVTDSLVVLVVDSRVKKELIDLSLEDAEVEATLVLDDTVISVYPPVPNVLTYDVGVLRHFLFIRKNIAVSGDET
jgi:hypothetical protein